MKSNKAIPNHHRSIGPQHTHKPNAPACFPTKNQIKNNQIHTLNKSSQKKIEMNNVSSSLSLRKGNPKPNSTILSSHQQIKANPQSRNNQPLLTETKSTDKFILRNAMYVRQKAMKLENEQRKKLYGVTSQCKFIPQLQTSKQHQKPQKYHQADNLMGETQKGSNLGTYQLQYYKKLQYEQFGYSKKHLPSSSINSKDIKRLLNESVQRFNSKLNSRQHQLKEDQCNQLLESKTNTMSYGELMDINNLIWISNQTQQVQARADPSVILPQYQHLIEYNLPDATQLSEEKQSDGGLLHSGWQSDGGLLHSDCQILTGLKQYKCEISPNQSLLQPITTQCLLENINDISDIPNQDHSLAYSDLFSCPIQQTQTQQIQAARESQQDEFPKCFKKQHQADIAQNVIEEKASSVQYSDCRAIQVEVLVDQDDSKIQLEAVQQAAGQVAVQQAVGQVAVQQAVGQVAVQQAAGQVAVQQAVGQVAVQQAVGQVAVIVENKQEQQPQLYLIDVAVDGQQQVEVKVQQLDFAACSHPPAHIEQTVGTAGTDKPNQPNDKNQIIDPIASKEVQTIKLAQTQESIKQILISQIKSQQYPTEDAEIKRTHYNLHHQQRELQVNQSNQVQPYVIDDYGNVILAGSIQIHRVGMCQIVVIPELPQQQARTLYS